MIYVADGGGYIGRELVKVAKNYAHFLTRDGPRATLTAYKRVSDGK
jgi:hypothetical protein